MPSIFKNVNWIVEPQYDGINIIGGEFISFRKNKKTGFMTLNGQVIIEAKFEDVLEFSEGLVGIKINNKWGYIDLKGNIVIEPQFDDLPGSFSEGLVRIAKFDRDIYSFKEEETISVRSKFGFADREGRIVIEPTYRHAGNFSEGLAYAGDDGKIGYINRYGDTIIDPIFDWAEDFKNQRAIVSIDHKCGLIRHPFN